VKTCIPGTLDLATCFLPLQRHFAIERGLPILYLVGAAEDGKALGVGAEVGPTG
jgi:hypothetical protein